MISCHTGVFRRHKTKDSVLKMTPSTVNAEKNRTTVCVTTGHKHPSAPTNQTPARTLPPPQPPPANGPVVHMSHGCACVIISLSVPSIPRQSLTGGGGGRAAAAAAAAAGLRLQ